MNTQLEQAAHKAVEVLDEIIKWYQIRDDNDAPMPILNQSPEIREAIEVQAALRDALEQPAQDEPVGQLLEEIYGRGQVMWFKKPVNLTMLYTRPQAREPQEFVCSTGLCYYRKPLTDEQREEIAKGWRGRKWTVGDIIDAIEAAHGIGEKK